MTTRRELLASTVAVAGAAAAGRLARAAGLSVEDPAPALPTPGPRAARLSGQPARWWSPLPDLQVACGLCFRGCEIPDGERGECGVRENRGGALATLVHSRPVALNLDPIEKKPFFHVLPGASALSLGTAGCNLHCRWCQNWEISQSRPEELPVATRSPEEIAALAVRKAAAVVACTYSEPTVFAEYVLDLAVASRKAGLKTVVVSNGTIREAPLRDLCEVLAAYKVDLKAFSERTYREMCGGERNAVLDTLRRLPKARVWTEVVTLVIPTVNDSEAEIRSLARFVRDEVGRETPLHFTRFHPTYRLTNLPPTPVATLERAREIALAEGLPFAYVGNVPGHPGESTYCPGCRARVIRRVGMATLENRLKKGACPDCGRAIPGVWS